MIAFAEVECQEVVPLGVDLEFRERPGTEFGGRGVQRSWVVGCDEHNAEVVAVAIELAGDRVERGVDAAAPEGLVDADRPAQRPALCGNRFPVHFDGLGKIQHGAHDRGKVGLGAGGRVGDGDESGDVLVCGDRDVHAAGVDGRGEPLRGMQD